jgi:hypothetical protein
MPDSLPELTPTGKIGPGARRGRRGYADAPPYFRNIEDFGV